MKNKFSEFYKLTLIEIDDLWSNGLFVIDANVLLDFYRFSKSTSNTFLEILKKIKANNQLWIPYQIGLEFHKHRNEIIDMEQNEYKRLIAYFSSKLSTEVETTFKENCNNHPLINIEKYMAEVKKMGIRISKSIKRLEKKHPDYNVDDNILNEVTELFEDDCIGEEFSESKLSEIYKEGSERYLKKIPPGYMDSKKPESDRYGDLVLWYQMIEKSNKSKKPIVFITRDTKNDWWHIHINGEKKGARRELIKEMKDKAGTKFYIYEISHFISLASKKLSIKVAKKLTQEIKTLKPIVIDDLHSRVAEGYTNLVAGNIVPAQVGTVSSNIGTADLSDAKRSTKSEVK